MRFGSIPVSGHRLFIISVVPLTCAVVFFLPDLVGVSAAIPDGHIGIARAILLLLAAAEMTKRLPMALNVILPVTSKVVIHHFRPFLISKIRKFKKLNNKCLV